MNPEPNSPETDQHAACAGNCDAAAAADDDSKQSFGVRGAVIAGSLGLALSACKSAPARDMDRMAVMYGPPAMMKENAASTGSTGAVVKDAPKPKKNQ